MFGVAHGMMFLPVILSLIGPAPTRDDHPSESWHEAHVEGKVIAEKDNKDVSFHVCVFAHIQWGNVVTRGAD